MTHVLLISHELIPSARLCGYEQFTRMQEQGLIEFRFSPSEHLTPELAGWADVVHFIRPDSRADLITAREMRKAGKYLICVLDDDLFLVPDGFQSSDYYQRENVKQNMRDVMKECHLFLSPSAHLRKKYGAGFARVGMIEEPSLFDNAPALQKNDTRIRIGFAGSTDRSGDISVILADTVRRLLADYGDRISIEFFGAKPSFADELGLRHIPYCESYAKYQETMQSLGWDIGLAPMPDTEFHRGKHYNKFVEYAACGIVGIYSDLLPYRGTVEHEVSGMLCQNDGESFYQAISRLIDSPELLARMRKNVVELATNRFSLSAVTEALKEELGDVLTIETDRKPLGFAKKLHRLDLTERFWAGIRKEGFFRFVWKKTKKFVFHIPETNL